MLHLVVSPYFLHQPNYVSLVQVDSVYIWQTECSMPPVLYSDETNSSTVLTDRLILFASWPELV